MNPTEHPWYYPALLKILSKHQIELTNETTKRITLFHQIFLQYLKTAFDIGAQFLFLYHFNKRIEAEVAYMRITRHSFQFLDKLDEYLIVSACTAMKIHRDDKDYYNSYFLESIYDYYCALIQHNLPTRADANSSVNGYDYYRNSILHLLNNWECKHYAAIHYFASLLLPKHSEKLSELLSYVPIDQLTKLRDQLIRSNYLDTNDIIQMITNMIPPESSLTSYPINHSVLFAKPTLPPSGPPEIQPSYFNQFLKFMGLG